MPVPGAKPETSATHPTVREAGGWMGARIRLRAPSKQTTDLGLSALPLFN